ncbi:hypothetical protein ISCGN_002911 [Ixodes scapularis]
MLRVCFSRRALSRSSRREGEGVNQALRHPARLLWRLKRTPGMTASETATCAPGADSGYQEPCECHATLEKAWQIATRSGRPNEEDNGGEESHVTGAPLRLEAETHFSRANKRVSGPRRCKSYAPTFRFPERNGSVMLCATRSSRSKSATGHSTAPSSHCQALRALSKAPHGVRQGVDGRLQGPLSRRPAPGQQRRQPLWSPTTGMLDSQRRRKLGRLFCKLGTRAEPSPGAQTGLLEVSSPWSRPPFPKTTVAKTTA